jgi:uncharacterized protein with ParB-like and HNH nuclease domain
LDYRDHKISIRKKNILKFIQQLAAGDFLVPTFQRSFVWHPDNIRNLWDSLYRQYPVGSILCWQTGILLHVHRKLGGFYIPDSRKPSLGIQRYILDGQQRATALLVSFYGGAGQVRDHSSFDYTLYSIPLIYLEGFDIAGVCDIYERINQTGTRLKNMDILIARGFKNYATVVEEDFPTT